MFDNRATKGKKMHWTPTVYCCVSCFYKNTCLLAYSSFWTYLSLREINHLSKHLKYWLIRDPEWRPGNSNHAPELKQFSRWMKTHLANYILFGSRWKYVERFPPWMITSFWMTTFLFISSTCLWKMRVGGKI